MTISEYRDTKSWQEAIKLAPQLLRLAEELPASEELGLSRQLRKLTVDLPAAVATDLHEGDGHSRIVLVFKLLAALDVVDRVYPALDTAATRTAADKLASRLTGPDFNERSAHHTPALEAGPVTDASAGSSAEPAPAAPAPAPASVPVLAEPATAAPAAHDSESNPGLKVSVASDAIPTEPHQES